ncbi:hypothetical protein GCM10022216_15660 [Sphingobacterium kyonggiense]|uniref:Uncharacterized protein n=1 Tax=Sphingobacterium kyonggiense TaxID=714075 RepID=A0ABP7YNG2_9SPHI
MVIPIITLAQEGQEYDIFPKWKVGDVMKYKINKSQSRYLNDSLENEVKSDYIVTLSVLDSFNAGYRLKWSYKFNFKSLGILESIEDPMHNMDSLDLVYLTDSYGGFTGLENWQEVGNTIEKQIDKIRKLADKVNPESTAINEEEFKAIIQLFKSKEMIQALAFREVGLLHSIYGSSYQVGIPQSRSEKKNFNSLPDNRIVINTITWLDSIDTSKQTILIKQEAMFDPESLNEFITTIQELAKVMDSETMDKDSIGFSLLDRSNMIFDYRSGIFKCIEFNRVIESTSAEETNKTNDLILMELIN